MKNLPPVSHVQITGPPMTPIESRFNDGMALANRMRHGGRASYWGGYVAGLMRGLFGAAAVTDTQHEVLAGPGTAGEEALGYRDGCAHVFASHPSERTPCAAVTETWENEGGSVARASTEFRV